MFGLEGAPAGPWRGHVIHFKPDCAFLERSPDKSDVSGVVFDDEHAHDVLGQRGLPHISAAGRGGCPRTRFLPSSFACLSARSAQASIVSGVISWSSLEVQAPMLTVIATAPSPTARPWPAIESQMRSAASMAALGLASGMMTMNSSPPKRTTT